MALCSCDNLTLGNMGIPNCAPIPKIAKRMIFVPYFKNDGTINKIDVTDTLDLAYINDRIQQYDSLGAKVALDERWYVTPLVENVSDVRAETVFQEFNSGVKVKIREGIRTFIGMFIKTPFELLKQVRKFQCSDIGVFFIDKDGNLIGNGSEEGFLRPIRIDKESFDAQFVKATDAETSMVMVQFDIYDLEKDQDLKMITADDFGVDLLSLNGLIDVKGTITGISTTGFTATLKANYGSAVNGVPIEGLVVGDFELEEVSPTPGTITITSVTETSAGVYVFVFPAATPADVLKLSLIKNGFDGSAIEALTITIP